MEIRGESCPPSLSFVRFIEMRALVNIIKFGLSDDAYVLIYASGLPGAVANPPRPRLLPKGDEDDPQG